MYLLSSFPHAALGLAQALSHMTMGAVAALALLAIFAGSHMRKVALAMAAGLAAMHLLF
ncbi:MAG TPA: hypothetical protein VIO94_07365 [Phenylobacterium sp.]